MSEKEPVLHPFSKKLIEKCDDCPFLGIPKTDRAWQVFIKRNCMNCSLTTLFDDWKDLAVAWFKREFPAIIEYLLYIIKKEGFTEEFEKFREMFKA